ncbi:MAG: hypothetical protein FIB08_07240 [Candidatus Methanoperedens sp.]|nr:hypothetical protein [Candidatus Methanoperedens sp.]
MRKREIAVVFLFMGNVLVVLTIPLWWDRAQPYVMPYINRLPEYMEILADYINRLVEAVSNIKPGIP